MYFDNQTSINLLEDQERELVWKFNYMLCLYPEASLKANIPYLKISSDLEKVRIALNLRKSHWFSQIFESF